MPRGRFAEGNTIVLFEFFDMRSIFSPQFQYTKYLSRPPGTAISLTLKHHYSSQKSTNKHVQPRPHPLSSNEIFHYCLMHCMIRNILNGAIPLLTDLYCFGVYIPG